MSRVSTEAKVGALIATTVAAGLAITGAVHHHGEDTSHDLHRLTTSELETKIGSLEVGASYDLSIGPNKTLEFTDNGAAVVTRRHNFSTEIFGKKFHSVAVLEKPAQIEFSNLDCLFNGALIADMTYSTQETSVQPAQEELFANFPQPQEEIHISFSPERTVKDVILGIPCADDYTTEELSSVSSLPVFGQEYPVTQG